MDNQNLCDIFKVILSSLYVEKLNDNEETKTPSTQDNNATKSNYKPSEVEDCDITTSTIKVSKENFNDGVSNSSSKLPKTSGFARISIIEISTLIIILALVGIKIKH